MPVVQPQVIQKQRGPNLIQKLGGLAGLAGAVAELALTPIRKRALEADLEGKRLYTELQQLNMDAARLGLDEARQKHAATIASVRGASLINSTLRYKLDQLREANQTGSLPLPTIGGYPAPAPEMGMAVPSSLKDRVPVAQPGTLGIKPEVLTGRLTIADLRTANTHDEVERYRKDLANSLGIPIDEITENFVVSEASTEKMIDLAKLTAVANDPELLRMLAEFDLTSDVGAPGKSVGALTLESLLGRVSSNEILRRSEGPGGETVFSGLLVSEPGKVVDMAMQKAGIDVPVSFEVNIPGVGLKVVDIGKSKAGEWVLDMMKTMTSDEAAMDRLTQGFINQMEEQFARWHYETGVSPAAWKSIFKTGRVDWSKIAEQDVPAVQAFLRWRETANMTLQYISPGMKAVLETAQGLPTGMNVKDKMRLISSLTEAWRKEFPWMPMVSEASWWEQHIPGGLEAAGGIDLGLPFGEQVIPESALPLIMQAPNPEHVEAYRNAQNKQAYANLLLQTKLNVQLRDGRIVQRTLSPEYVQAVIRASVPTRPEGQTNLPLPPEAATQTRPIGLTPEQAQGMLHAPTTPATPGVAPLGGPMPPTTLPPMQPRLQREVMYDISQNRKAVRDLSVNDALAQSRLKQAQRSLELPHNKGEAVQRGLNRAISQLTQEIQSNVIQKQQLEAESQMLQMELVNAMPGPQPPSRPVFQSRPRP